MLSGQMQHAEARVNSLQFTCRLRKRTFSDGKWQAPGSGHFSRRDYFPFPVVSTICVIDLIISFLEKPLHFPSQFAGVENARKK